MADIEGDFPEGFSRQTATYESDDDGLPPMLTRSTVENNEHLNINFIWHDGKEEQFETKTIVEAIYESSLKNKPKEYKEAVTQALIDRLEKGIDSVLREDLMKKEPELYQQLVQWKTDRDRFPPDGKLKSSSADKTKGGSRMDLPDF